MLVILKGQRANDKTVSVTHLFRFTFIHRCIFKFFNNTPSLGDLTKDNMLPIKMWCWYRCDEKL